MQGSFDGFKALVNNTSRQNNRKKLLPKQAPDHVYRVPERYNGMQSGLVLDETGRQLVRDLMEQYCSNPCDIDYLPRAFRDAAEYAYERLGFEKDYDMLSVWDMFKRMKTFMLTGE